MTTTPTAAAGARRASPFVALYRLFLRMQVTRGRLLALTALCARLPLRREAVPAPAEQEPSEPKAKVTA